MRTNTLGKLVRFAAIGALAMTGLSAQAATMTFTDNASASKVISSIVDARSTSSETPSKTESVTNALQDAMLLDQFDATLGTLTGIEITARVIPLRSFGNVTVTCVDSGRINSACASSSGSKSETSSGGADTPFDGTSSFLSFQRRSIDPSFFANFVGTGSISIPWRISYTHTVSASCDPSFLTSIELCQATGGILFTFNATAEITYTYEEPVINAVPLPAGMPLLLAGLGGLAFLRRRG